MKIGHHQFSTFSLLTFTFLLILSGVYSEFFRPRLEKEMSKTQLLVNPIRKDIIKNLKEVTLINTNNKFILKKNDHKWKLVSPVNMKASIENLQYILNTLSSLEIKTLFKNDKVNVQNFSLKRPLMQVELISNLNENQKIDFGMINSVDQSSYLKASNVNAIFQTNIISDKLMKLNLSNFIDNKIFPKNIDNISKIQVLNPNYKEGIKILEKVGNNWISNKYKTISNESTARKIKRIMNVSAKVIIDNANEKTKNFLNNYLKNPRLEVTIWTKNKERRKFLISYLVNKNDALRIGRNENFIIKDMLDNSIYLVGKESFNQFNIRYADLR